MCLRGPLSTRKACWDAVAGGVFHPTPPSSNNNLVFHSGNWRRGEERRKEKLGLHTQQQHTAHCALAHPHPTYSISIDGGVSGQFPVECSVDLSQPGFGRVAQEIRITYHHFYNIPCRLCSSLPSPQAAAAGAGAAAARAGGAAPSE